MNVAVSRDLDCVQNGNVKESVPAKEKNNALNVDLTPWVGIKECYNEFWRIRADIPDDPLAESNIAPAYFAVPANWAQLVAKIKYQEEKFGISATSASFFKCKLCSTNIKINMAAARHHLRFKHPEISKVKEPTQYYKIMLNKPTRPDNHTDSDTVRLNCEKGIYNTADLATDVVKSIDDKIACEIKKKWLPAVVLDSNIVNEHSPKSSTCEDYSENSNSIIIDSESDQAGENSADSNVSLSQLDKKVGEKESDPERDVTVNDNDSFSKTSDCLNISCPDVGHTKGGNITGNNGQSTSCLTEKHSENEKSDRASALSEIDITGSKSSSEIKNSSSGESQKVKVYLKKAKTFKPDISQICKVCFISTEDLQKHKNEVHTWAFKCNICFRGPFYRQHVAIEHSKRHSSVFSHKSFRSLFSPYSTVNVPLKKKGKRVKCIDCNLYFMNLHAHSAQHTSVTCITCDKFVSLEKCLKPHLKEHGIVVDDDFNVSKYFKTVEQSNEYEDIRQNWKPRCKSLNESVCERTSDDHKTGSSNLRAFRLPRLQDLPVLATSTSNQATGLLTSTAVRLPQAVRSRTDNLSRNGPSMSQDLACSSQENPTADNLPSEPSMVQEEPDLARSAQERPTDDCRTTRPSQSESDLACSSQENPTADNLPSEPSMVQEEPDVARSAQERLTDDCRTTRPSQPESDLVRSSQGISTDSLLPSESSTPDDESDSSQESPTDDLSDGPFMIQDELDLVCSSQESSTDHHLPDTASLTHDISVLERSPLESPTDDHLPTRLMSQVKTEHESPEIPTEHYITTVKTESDSVCSSQETPAEEHFKTEPLTTHINSTDQSVPAFSDSFILNPQRTWQREITPSSAFSDASSNVTKAKEMEFVFFRRKHNVTKIGAPNVSKVTQPLQDGETSSESESENHHTPGRVLVKQEINEILGERSDAPSCVRIKLERIDDSCNSQTIKQERVHVDDELNNSDSQETDVDEELESTQVGIKVKEEDSMNNMGDGLVNSDSDSSDSESSCEDTVRIKVENAEDSKNDVDTKPCSEQLETIPSGVQFKVVESLHVYWRKGRCILCTKKLFLNKMGRHLRCSHNLIRKCVSCSKTFATTIDAEKHFRNEKKTNVEHLLYEWTHSPSKKSRITAKYQLSSNEETNMVSSGEKPAPKTDIKAKSLLKAYWNCGKCVLCQKEMTLLNLSKHLRQRHNLIRQCTKCPITFKTGTEADQHAKDQNHWHAQWTTLKSKSAISESILASTQVYFENGVCILCKKTTKSFDLHLRRKHELVLRCSDCHATFDKSVAATNHVIANRLATPNHAKLHYVNIRKKSKKVAAEDVQPEEGVTTFAESLLTYWHDGRCALCQLESPYHTMSVHLRRQHNLVRQCSECSIIIVNTVSAGMHAKSSNHLLVRWVACAPIEQTNSSEPLLSEKPQITTNPVGLSASSSLEVYWCDGHCTLCGKEMSSRHMAVHLTSRHNLVRKCSECSVTLMTNPAINIHAQDHEDSDTDHSLVKWVETGKKRKRDSAPEDIRPRDVDVSSQKPVGFSVVAATRVYWLNGRCVLCRKVLSRPMMTCHLSYRHNLVRKCAECDTTLVNNAAIKLHAINFKHSGADHSLVKWVQVAKKRRRVSISSSDISMPSPENEAKSDEISGKKVANKLRVKWVDSKKRRSVSIPSKNISSRDMSITPTEAKSSEKHATNQLLDASSKKQVGFSATSAMRVYWLNGRCVLCQKTLSLHMMTNHLLYRHNIVRQCAECDKTLVTSAAIKLHTFNFQHSGADHSLVKWVEIGKKSRRVSNTSKNISPCDMEMSQTESDEESNTENEAESSENKIAYHMKLIGNKIRIDALKSQITNGVGSVLAYWRAGKCVLCKKANSLRFMSSHLLKKHKITRECLVCGYKLLSTKDAFSHIAQHPNLASDQKFIRWLTPNASRTKSSESKNQSAAMTYIHDKCGFFKQKICTLCGEYVARCHVSSHLLKNHNIVRQCATCDVVLPTVGSAEKHQAATSHNKIKWVTQILQERDDVDRTVNLENGAPAKSETQLQSVKLASIFKKSGLFKNKICTLCGECVARRHMSSHLLKKHDLVRQCVTCDAVFNNIESSLNHRTKNGNHNQIKWAAASKVLPQESAKFCDKSGYYKNNICTLCGKSVCRSRYYPHLFNFHNFVRQCVTCDIVFTNMLSSRKHNTANAGHKIKWVESLSLKQTSSQTSPQKQTSSQTSPQKQTSSQTSPQKQTSSQTSPQKQTSSQTSPQENTSNADFNSGLPIALNRSSQIFYRKGKCLLCDSFLGSKVISKHLYHHHNWVRECEDCGETFMNKETVRRHSMLNSHKVHWVAVVPKKPASTSKKKNIAKSYKLGYTPYWRNGRCILCQEENNFTLMGTHLRKTHKMIQVCIDCDLPFSTSVSVYKHLETTGHTRAHWLNNRKSDNEDSPSIKPLIPNVTKAVEVNNAWSCNLCDQIFTLKCNCLRHIGAVHQVHEKKRNLFITRN